MKARLFIWIIGLLFFGPFTHIYAAGDQEGNGTLRYVLEGFEPYPDPANRLKRAIEQAHQMVVEAKLDTIEDLPELAPLLKEIGDAHYILMPSNRAYDPNRFPGDYAVAGELLATTDCFRGAPTKLFPGGIESLRDSEITELVMHEAVHRSLPEPLNSYEPVVDRVAKMVVQYSQPAESLRKYLTSVKGKKIPWPVLFVESVHSTIPLFVNVVDDLSAVGRIVRLAQVDQKHRIQIDLNARSYDNKNFNVECTVKDVYRGIEYRRVYPDFTKEDFSDPKKSTLLTKALVAYIDQSIGLIEAALSL